MATIRKLEGKTADPVKRAKHSKSGPPAKKRMYNQLDLLDMLSDLIGEKLHLERDIESKTTYDKGAWEAKRFAWLKGAIKDSGHCRANYESKEVIALLKERLAIDPSLLRQLKELVAQATEDPTIDRYFSPKGARRKLKVVAINWIEKINEKENRFVPVVLADVNFSLGEIKYVEDPDRITDRSIGYFQTPHPHDFRASVSMSSWMTIDSSRGHEIETSEDDGLGTISPDDLVYQTDDSAIGDRVPVSWYEFRDASACKDSSDASSYTLKTIVRTVAIDLPTLKTIEGLVQQ
jgi:hypothetical protein